MKRLAGKLISWFGLAVLFLLPLFGWISAEPAHYQDAEGLFSVLLPDGWQADDSGYMGQGVVLKGPAGTSGAQPVVHLLHEEKGVVTLDERWYAHLGRLRYDLTRVNILSMENREESDPPHFQATYTWREGEEGRKALSRITLFGDRLFLVTASAPEEEFEALLPLFLAVQDSLRAGGR